MLKSFFAAFLVFFLCQFLTPSFVYAYIDPGSGSFFVEAAIAAVVGVIFALKLCWRKIISLFTCGKNGKNKR